MKKHLLIGLGAIGKSFLRILVEQCLFDSDSFFCVDPDPKVIEVFIGLGGLPSHFTCAKITKNTYADFLNEYRSGDFVFNLANDIKDLDLLRLALQNGFHYLSLSDSNWDPDDPTWSSVHQHFLEYQKILKHIKKGTNTSLIEFGMNPGLVSSFAKKCIEQIVATDNNSFIQKNRKRLQKLIKKEAYGSVAKIIGVELVVEVDHDNQSYNTTCEESCLYSPWSPSSFCHESLSAPEIIVGTRKQFYQFDKVRDCDFHDYYLSLPFHGIDCQEKVYSPQGIVDGYLIAHEEVFSLRQLFTSGNYKPTVFFVYCPCHIAKKSIQNIKKNPNTNFKLLEREELLNGGESVGIILQGKHFNTAYYGNYLDCSKLTNETPTVLQVSASALAAYKYICNHPNDGILFPEAVNANEVLKTASEYLGEYQFRRCPDIIPRFKATL